MLFVGKVDGFSKAALEGIVGTELKLQFSFFRFPLPWNINLSSKCFMHITEYLVDAEFDRFTNLIQFDNKSGFSSEKVKEEIVSSAGADDKC